MPFLPPNQQRQSTEGKVVSYGRSVDKTVTYTLVDHSNQEAVLERYDKVKDLGVWFDEKLSFRQHIQDKINKALHDACMFGCFANHVSLASGLILTCSSTQNMQF